MKTNKFWEGEAEKHIIPNTGTEFPEGWDVLNFLTELLPYKQITEVGCGWGRLCKAFSPYVYSGIDINENVVTLAKERFPQYKFTHTKEMPVSENKLLYTVLLHISDEDIKEFIKTLCNSTKERIVVAEILGRDWRRAGNPPVFNRNLEEYESYFEKENFVLEKIIKKPYNRYINWDKQDTNISFMIFMPRGQTGTGT